MDYVSYEDWFVVCLVEVSVVFVVYFVCLFKQVFGLLLYCYLLSCCIEWVVVLLCDIDLLVIEIVVQIGWSSLGIFGCIFCDIIGDSFGNVCVCECWYLLLCGVVFECYVCVVQWFCFDMFVLE